MKGVEAFRVSIQLLTPTIITSLAGYRGMSYSVVSSYIPGSMVRGALFTRMLLERLLNEKTINEESLRPRHAVSPALYVPHWLDKALPFSSVSFAHALAYTLKSGRDGGSVYSLGLDRLLDAVRKGVDVQRALSELIFEHSLRMDCKAYSEALERPDKSLVAVFRSSTEARPAQGLTIARKGGSWLAVSPERGIYAETAVDRARGSAAHGALYAYEYIVPGSRFVALLSAEEGSPIAEALNSLSGCIEVRIGRGTGRGFGIARMCIERLGSDERSELENEEVRSGEIVALCALSPLATLTPLPEPVAPSVGAIDVKVFGSKAGRFDVIAVLGRGTQLYTGWSYRTRSPKLPIKANTPGTIVIARVTQVSELLRETALAGINELSSQGMSFVKILTRDYIPEG